MLAPRSNPFNESESRHCTSLASAFNVDKTRVVNDSIHLRYYHDYRRRIRKYMKILLCAYTRRRILVRKGRNLRPVDTPVFLALRESSTTKCRSIMVIQKPSIDFYIFPVTILCGRLDLLIEASNQHLPVWSFKQRQWCNGPRIMRIVYSVYMV